MTKYTRARTLHIFPSIFSPLRFSPRAVFVASLFVVFVFWFGFWLFFPSPPFMSMCRYSAVAFFSSL